MTEDEFDSVIRVHLKGTFNTMHHASAYWRERVEGRATSRGRRSSTRCRAPGLQGQASQANYGAAKAGIAAMTIIASLELGRYGVRANCIGPGGFTRMVGQAMKDITVKNPEEYETFDGMNPGNSSPGVVWLASDDSIPVTGQVLRGVGNTHRDLQAVGAGRDVLQHRQGRQPHAVGPGRDRSDAAQVRTSTPSTLASLDSRAAEDGRMAPRLRDDHVRGAQRRRVGDAQPARAPQRVQHADAARGARRVAQHALQRGRALRRAHRRGRQGVLHRHRPHGADGRPNRRDHRLQRWSARTAARPSTSTTPATTWVRRAATCGSRSSRPSTAWRAAARSTCSARSSSSSPPSTRRSSTRTSPTA